MPKFSPIQTSFVGGEISPMVRGRTDLDRYKESLKTCTNMIPTVQGGLTRRPGTNFVAETKNSEQVRLIPFNFSISQAYILEFGDLYIRFYKDRGVIESAPNVPYEVVTTYAAADIPKIRFTQSADVLYLFHPDYPPAKLKRYGDADWELEELDLLDGPYLNVRDFGARIFRGAGILTAFRDGTAAAQLTPSASSGSSTVTLGSASNVSSSANNGSGLVRITLATSDVFATGDRVEIIGHSVAGYNGTWTLTQISSTQYDLVGSTYSSNGTGGTIHAGLFYASDVGRRIRIRHAAQWGWGEVTAYNNARSITVNVRSNLSATTATPLWRLGVYYDDNYPATGIFHEDRLILAGAPDSPQRVDASVTSDYENFAPTDTANPPVTDNSNAWAFGLNSSDVNTILTLSSDEKGLIGLTAGGEWVVRPNSFNEALTPSNVNAKKTSTYGTADTQCIQSGRATLFIQRTGRKLREFAYYYDVDGFRATDLSVLSEHITGNGVTELALQKSPQNIIWQVRQDGLLIGCTYDREGDNLRAGWHKHVIGGVSDAAQNNAVVETVACIISPNLNSEDLWIVVKRYIDGNVVRYVEYIGDYFNDRSDQKEAFFVDSGLTYDVPLNITNVAVGATTTVTSNAHGFSNGDLVFIEGVFGNEYTNDDGEEDSINGKTYEVVNAAPNTFELDGIDSTTWTNYISGGTVRKKVITISGLDHLEGEEVAVCADGGAHPNVIVQGGAITLQDRYAVVHVGLPYVSDAELLRIEGGSAHGTSIGKTRRVNRIMLQLERTLGLKVGTDFSKLDEVYFRSQQDIMGLPPPLFSGLISTEIEADYDLDNCICIRQDYPLPLTLLSVSQILTEYDR